MSKNKDPAILFYTSDFLSGVADLTMEERGQYITLLCLQHQKGHLSSKVIKTAIGKVSADVLKKFIQDADGNYYNERMKNEIEKRKRFVECRQENGKKGGRPPKNEKPIGEPNKNLSVSRRLTYEEPKQNLPENENGIITKDISITKNNNSFSFSNNTTTTTNIFSQDACAQDESEEYAIFTLKVTEYFVKNNFTSSAQDFIVYNESRGWRGIGGEDVKKDFTRYADQWEEIQKLKAERFNK